MTPQSAGDVQATPVRAAARIARQEPVLPPPAAPASAPAAPPASTRWQRLALLGGLLATGYIALQLFASVLTPFVAAAGIAYFLDPPATRLQRAGVARGPASLLMIVALLALALLFALLLYPLILSQVALLLGRVPQYATLAQAWAREIITHLQDRFGSDVVDDKLRDLVGGQAGAMLGFIGGALSRLIGGGFAIFNVITLMIVTPVVAFYLLRDWPSVVARIDGWTPRRYAVITRAQAHEVDRILSAWVRGQILCCMILALFYAAALTVIGLDLGLIVGLAAGALSFIPYVGSIAGGLSALGLAVAQFPDWHGVILVGIVLIVGQILEGYVIYPRFLGDRVELPAVWVIFALFAGGAVGGFLGVMLAVPVAATIGVLCRFWLRRYLRSPLYLEPPTPGAA